MNSCPARSHPYARYYTALKPAGPAPRGTLRAAYGRQRPGCRHDRRTFEGGRFGMRLVIGLFCLAIALSMTGSRRSRRRDAARLIRAGGAAQRWPRARPGRPPTGDNGAAPAGVCHPAGRRLRDGSSSSSRPARSGSSSLASGCSPHRSSTSTRSCAASSPAASRASSVHRLPPQLRRSTGNFYVYYTSSDPTACTPVIGRVPGLRANPDVADTTASAARPVHLVAVSTKSQWWLNSSSAPTTVTSTSGWATAAAAAIPSDNRPAIWHRSSARSSVSTSTAPRPRRPSPTSSRPTIPSSTRLRARRRDLGLRPPQSLAVTPSIAARADLYIADVGQGLTGRKSIWAGSGLNFGWNVTEGAHCYPPGASCSFTGFTLPVTEYDHSQGCSVTGGYVYIGAPAPPNSQASISSATSAARNLVARSGSSQTRGRGGNSMRTTLRYQLVHQAQNGRGLCGSLPAACTPLRPPGPARSRGKAPA